MGARFKTLEWRGGGLIILDQRRLPGQEKYTRIRRSAGVVSAIRSLAVRGAPAIGVAAGYAGALAANETRDADPERFAEKLGEKLDRIASARPTAVNLRWAVERVRRAAGGGQLSAERARRAVLAEARAMHREDIEACRLIGEAGRGLARNGAKIMTHCNAGALATTGIGTALAVVRAAFARGVKLSVIACETRPVLQGARLTAWELKRDGIPVTLITDGMAAHIMSRGMVDLVITGADRIAANGDSANKIGTYSHAIAAAEHGIPFYIAAPLSTIDRSAASGADIPIEMRDESEVTHFARRRIAPVGVRALNPAFDVTPARFIAGIITERGIASPPYGSSIAKLFRGSRRQVENA
jgi:methylthioribose-1-phosphate isomerase